MDVIKMDAIHTKKGIFFFDTREEEIRIRDYHHSL